MSYLHDHCSNDGVPSPSRTRRPTPAPPLKSVTGAKDRALDGSAMLRASAVAKMRGIDSSCFMFLLVLLARGVSSSLRLRPSYHGEEGARGDVHCGSLAVITTSPVTIEAETSYEW